MSFSPPQKSDAHLKKQESQQLQEFQQWDYEERGFWWHMKDLTRRNPFVPLGFGVTVWMMAQMIRNKSDKLLLNKFARYRILAQTGTFMALIGGMYNDERSKYQDGEYRPWLWDLTRFRNNKYK